MRVLATLDKFRGTASAAEAASAVSAACWELGVDCREVPMSDGGEGILDVLGGPNRTATVTGPLGRPVDAAWGIHGRVAIIEMARASGLVLAGGAGGNDPLGATTAGTGELVERAIESGAPNGASSAWVARPPPTAASARSRCCAARLDSGRSSSGWRATCAPRSSTPPPCSLRRRAPRRPW